MTDAARWALVVVLGLGLVLLLGSDAHAEETDAGSTDMDTTPTMMDDAAAAAAEVAALVLTRNVSEMTMSPAGVAALQRRESCRLQRYRGGDGGWTIGWGRFFPDGGADVCPDSITQAQADAWLAEDLEARAARWVRAFVTVDLTQPQFDALCSMAYNMRPSSFRTIAAEVNAGNDPQAAALRFVRAGTQLEAGLRRRRAGELDQFRADPNNYG